jgi:hypothetical protein
MRESLLRPLRLEPVDQTAELADSLFVALTGAT